jgi:hypothetical protein
MAACWGPPDNAKLITLWRTPHNQISSSTKLDKDSVKAVHLSHFKHTKYANFAPLYWGKARAFNVSNTLDGHRKRESDCADSGASSASADPTNFFAIIILLLWCIWKEANLAKLRRPAV